MQTESQQSVVRTQHSDLREGGIAILDFGSQYTQLIARRVREQGVYAEVFPCDADVEKVNVHHPQGYILSGGPNSIYEEGAPQMPGYVLKSGLPVLGVCYGMQALTHSLGGVVAGSQHKEFGLARIVHKAENNPLFNGVPGETDVWMSHGDRIEQPPHGFETLAHSDNSPYAAMGDGRAWVVRCAVPCRSSPHATRRANSPQFHLRHLPLRSEMVGSGVH